MVPSASAKPSSQDVGRGNDATFGCRDFSPPPPHSNFAHAQMHVRSFTSQPDLSNLRIILTFPASMLICCTGRETRDSKRSSFRKWPRMRGKISQTVDEMCLEVSDFG